MNHRAIRITPAKGSDLAAIRNLLRLEGLPESDLTDTSLRDFLVARDPAGDVVGAVGLEVSGDVALLRSLVVRPDQSGAGLGGRLTSAAESLASRRGVSTLFLLTTTAQQFFARRGFDPAEREAVPTPIRRSAQFRTLCPDTAALYMRSLKRDAIASHSVSPLYRRIYRIVSSIPSGRVAAYGEIARLAGSTPRTVGYAMASVPDGSDVPWHRVINRQGRISVRADGQPSIEQRRRLEDEGVAFDARGRVSFDRYGWRPPDPLP